MSHKQIHKEKQQKNTVLLMKFHQFFTSSSLEMFKYDYLAKLPNICSVFSKICFKKNLQWLQPVPVGQ